MKRTLTPAEKSGLTAIILAGLISIVDLKLAALPLAIFLVLCILAPFFPTVGFFLPVISKGSSSRKAVALTFDDGPDPECTPALLELLLRHDLKATFFVTGKGAREHPRLIESIIAQGHTIGNHTYSHAYLALFISMGAMRREIELTQKILNGFGVKPLAFRPPAGITNPRLIAVLRNADMDVVNFSCRAYDGGNRWIKRISKRILKRVEPGDIILLHDNLPQTGQPVSEWLAQIEKVILGLKKRGLQVLSLPDLIGKPVMRVQSPKKIDPPSGRKN